MVRDKHIPYEVPAEPLETFRQNALKRKGEMGKILAEKTEAEVMEMVQKPKTAPPNV